MKKAETRLKLYHRQYEIEVEKYETLSQEMHLHDTYEIEFISKGRGTHRINNKEYPIKRGMMYALRLRDYHSFEGEEAITVHKIKMPVKCMPEKLSYGMLKHKADMVTQLSDELADHVENLFLFLESRPKAYLNDEIYIQEALINIIVTVFTNHETAFPQDVYLSDGEKVDKVMLYLEDNFRRKISIADVADHFGMNPNYLNRIFKEEKGVTLYAAVKDIRLEYAKKLLVETDLSTSEICATCGYSGEANFQRDFKKEFDTSPMKYRKCERERLAEEKDKG